jgi:WD40 repeat protein
MSIWLYRVTGRHIFQRLAAHRNGVQCVTASPHLDRIASGADDHMVINWDLATPRPSGRWSASEQQFVTAMAYSPDGALLATGTGGTGGTGAGWLAVRDAETGEIKARLAGQKVGIYCLAFDPSGRRLASGHRNGQVILWDLNTGQMVQQLYVGPSFVWSILFLDNGRKLLSEVSNGPVVLFDLQSGRREKEITLPGGIRRFIADPARKRLIVAFNNGDLCDLSIPDLTPGRRLEHAHPSAIESLALSPDGRLLVTGGADRRAVFRDPVTFEPLLALPEWTAMVKDLAFTPSGRWLAYVGADSDVALWDLTALREGLQARGLAWDQSAPAAIAASSRPAAAAGATAEVPVLRFTPDGVDLASLEQARQLVESGIAAYRGGRVADAIRDLEQARDRLRPLHEATPASHHVASQLGSCLLNLGKALRDQRRAAEAVASFKEGSQVPEMLREPGTAELYDLARMYAQLAALVEPTPAGVSERQAMADRAMEALRRSLAADYNTFANIDRDDDLDPLRRRPDFRALMTGRLREIIPDIAKMSAAKPTDTELSLKVAALQAWFGQEKEFAATRQRLLALAKDTNEANTADRAAKACSLMPNSDKAELDAAMALARAALKLDQRKQWEDWELVALGMAEYRAGNYADAEKTLLAAAAAGPANPQVTGISGFYRAMSVQRQGKADEARKLAADAAAKMKPLPADELNTLADASHDDLILWVAYKEAKALIQFDAAPPKAKIGK